MPDEQLTPRDWLHDVLSKYGVRSMRYIDRRSDDEPYAMNVRTHDGREMIVTAREIDDDMGGD